MRKIIDDNKETISYYFELVKKCQEIVEFYDEEWKSLYDDNNEYVADYKLYQVGDFKIHLWYDPEDGKYPAHYSLTVSIGDIDLFYYNYDLKYYERCDANLRWIESIDKMYNYLETAKEVKKKKKQKEEAQKRKAEIENRKKAFAIIRKWIKYCPQTNREDKDDNHRLISFLHDRDFEFKEQCIAGTPNEYMKHYSGSFGFFVVYQVYHKHLLVAEIFPNEKYDDSEYVINRFCPGSWIEYFDRAMRDWEYQENERMEKMKQESKKYQKKRWY